MPSELDLWIFPLKENPFSDVTNFFSLFFTGSVSKAIK